VLIDPFTVIAQIVNFAILAIALKYVLYDRVIGAMDQREASIATRLLDAEQRETEAQAEIDDYRHRRRALEDRDQELLDEARDHAEHHRRQLIDEARSDVELERLRWERALRREMAEFQHEVQRRSTQEVVELTRQVLSDLAGTDLEQVVLDRALERLEADPGTVTAGFAAGFADGHMTSPVTVRTSFPVSPDRQRRVIDRLRSIGLDSDRPVVFERSHALLLGAEFQGDGTAVSWNADDYLDRLGADVHHLIDSVDREGGHGPTDSDHPDDLAN
jgi:F-type H+-transporting ATPase subunit b